MSSVTFEGVTKRFGSTVAVGGLDLVIADGEFCVLLGPSGCGKTTALRMIAGLETVSEGSLLIGDIEVNDQPARSRDIAMVFQSYALYPHMTVHKYIESPLAARGGMDSGERSKRVAEAAEMLGLTEYLDRKPGALSGGQRQRVALARAIVRRPGVFLMDEPLSNLDAKLRTQTRLELVDLWRRLGTTFVYVTHDQVEAMTMATTVAIMKDGRLQQFGAPQAVYDHPANLFVARFIGSPPMNTIDGVEHGSGITTAAGTLDVAIVGAFSGSSDPVVIGIRPEHLEVSAPTNDGATLSASVLAIELLGHERHVVCAVGTERWTIRQPTHADPIGVGDSVGLSVERGAVHRFHATSGERIDP